MFMFAAAGNKNWFREPDDVENMCLATYVLPPEPVRFRQAHVASTYVARAHFVLLWAVVATVTHARHPSADHPLEANSEFPPTHSPTNSKSEEIPERKHT